MEGVKGPNYWPMIGFSQNNKQSPTSNFFTNHSIEMVPRSNHTYLGGGTHSDTFQSLKLDIERPRCALFYKIQ